MTKNLRQLDIAVDASISFASGAQARAAVKALIPDNVNMPKGLSLQLFSKGRGVFVEIRGKGVPMATVINTLDEVLEHLSVAKKVMA
ncbi:MAG: KEOPS complex subunit Pcc1 [Nitrososphaera sp.]|uniref:KEOPS complex subunit Pcc1 n=1 Tax=Nitrososphaera sp. TaxID=1971748 RepID=UPI003D6E22D9